MKRTFLIGTLSGVERYSYAPLLMEIEIIKTEKPLYTSIGYFKGNIFRDGRICKLTSRKQFSELIAFKIKRVLQRIPTSAEYLNTKDFLNYIDTHNNNKTYNSFKTRLKPKKPIKKDFELAGDNIYLMPKIEFTSLIFRIDDSFKDIDMLAKREFRHILLREIQLNHSEVYYDNRYWRDNINDFCIIYNPNSKNIKSKTNQNLYENSENEMINSLLFSIANISSYSAISNHQSDKLKLAMHFANNLQDINNIADAAGKEKILFSDLEFLFNIDYLETAMPFIRLNTCFSPNRQHFEDSLIGNFKDFINNNKYYILSKGEIDSVVSNYVNDNILIQDIRTRTIENLKSFLKE